MLLKDTDSKSHVIFLRKSSTRSEGLNRTISNIKIRVSELNDYKAQDANVCEQGVTLLDRIGFSKHDSLYTCFHYDGRSMRTQASGSAVRPAWQRINLSMVRRGDSTNVVRPMDLIGIADSNPLNPTSPTWRMYRHIWDVGLFTNPLECTGKYRQELRRYRTDSGVWHSMNHFIVSPNLSRHSDEKA